MPRAGNTTSRGYGSFHQKRRAAMPAPVGQACPFCAGPMWPSQRLHLDHQIPSVLGGAYGPVRWSHGSCNSSAGSRLKNELLRRPVKPRWANRWV